MNWRDKLSPRELAQVSHACDYATNHSSAGVPGHNHLLLIAFLAQLLDDLTPDEEA